MMTHCVLASLLSLSLSAGRTWDADVQEEETVSVAARLSHDGVHAGADVRAALILKIRTGWHINTASPSDENLVATAVACLPPAGLSVADTQYPGGVMKKFAFSESPLDVYEGTVVIRLRISVAAGVTTGVYQIPVDVSYQACTNDLCLAPATAHVVIPVHVIAPDISPAPVNPELFGGGKDR
jgi:thiol:disulfide interchange protein DsbD